MQLEPEAQAVGPDQPLPPHWPYLVWAPPTGAAVVVGTATVLVLRVVLVAVVLLVVVVLTVDEVVVVALTVDDVVVVLTVDEVAAAPPGSVADEVAVATDTLWAMELAAPAMRAGPGTVYTGLLT